MGTHGRGGLEHLFLGSVAEKLIRRLPCPVLTVCHEEGRTWEAPGLITRIICATDFSETSSEALRFALSFADEAQSRLTLLHVIENIPDFGDPTTIALPYLGPLRQDLERAALERLEKLVEGARDSGVNLDARVAFGRAYREILRIAANEQADLVVVGAQGHGLIEHMLSGSNAQHVIRGATCPVLTVRPLKARRRREAGAAGLTLAASAASHS
jgi:nucleotide-binding universal stress UspA family protein